jgi:succinylarginine dihydrolase
MELIASTSSRSSSDMMVAAEAPAYCSNQDIAGGKVHVSKDPLGRADRLTSTDLGLLTN